MYCSDLCEIIDLKRGIKCDKPQAHTRALLPCLHCDEGFNRKSTLEILSKLLCGESRLQINSDEVFFSRRVMMKNFACFSRKDSWPRSNPPFLEGSGDWSFLFFNQKILSNRVRDNYLNGPETLRRL